MEAGQRRHLGQRPRPGPPDARDWNGTMTTSGNRGYSAAGTYARTPTKTVTVDGLPFAYRRLGPEDGVPVVFLHHLGGNLDEWDPRVVDGIAARHPVITFDNRGVGASGG